MLKKIESFEYDFYGDLFIDIGGNVGMWTSQLYDYYKKIIFVEPSNEALNAAIININDRQNKVIFLKNICSIKDNQVKSIYTPSDDSGQFSVFGKELYNTVNRAEEDIKTITLDSLISDAKGSSRILIKIDTEGCDLDVILGGKEFIKKFKPTMAIEFHFHMYFDKTKYDEVVNFLNAQGYRMTEYKLAGYLSVPNRMYSGNNKGADLYDQHYHVLAEPA